MKEFVIYTLSRAGLFVAAYVVIGGVWLLAGQKIDGTTGFVFVVIAAVVSSVLSLKLLAGQRTRFAARVDARATRAAAKFDEMRAREDAD